MLDKAEVYAMIDSLGDVGTTLKDATTAGLTRLYEGSRLQLRYEPRNKPCMCRLHRVWLVNVSEAGVAHYPYASN